MSDKKRVDESFSRAYFIKSLTGHSSSSIDADVFNDTFNNDNQNSDSQNDQSANYSQNTQDKE